MKQDWRDESPNLVVVPHLPRIVTSKFIKHFKVRPQEVDWSHCILRLGPGDDECCNENKDIHHSDDEDEGED